MKTKDLRRKSDRLLAPGVTLAMGAVSTSLAFIQRVNDLVGWGADIIVDDLGVFGQPYFEDGTVAEAYADAIAAGVVMVSAAGNSAQGHYQAPYTNHGSLTLDGIEYSRPHSFGAGDATMNFTVPEGGDALVYLQWTNPFGQSGDDYDLHILDETGVRVAFSVNFQTGIQDPVEATSVSCTTAGGCTFQVLVNQWLGTTQTIELFILSGTPTQYNLPADSIFGHPALPGVIGTGAIDASDSGNMTIESFSSHGPSTIAFPSIQVRATPTLVAIDGVSVTGVGGFSSPFFGTSSAAPHVAAVATLILEADPSLTPAEVASVIQNTAADRGTPGYDNTYGSGLIDALAAVISIDSAVNTPEAVSVTPGSGSGTEQRFSFLFSDGNGTGDLSSVAMLVNDRLSAASACYVWSSDSRFWLRNDASSAWLGPVTVGTASSLTNSQCTVNAEDSSISNSGNDRTINLAVTFDTAFQGDKTVYMFAHDNGGLSSGWQTRGTWTVPPEVVPAAPVAVSVTPESGSGAGPTFSFLFSDENGAADIEAARMVVANSLSAAYSCYVWLSNGNDLLLRDDASTQWLGPVSVGSAGSLANSQCTVNAEDSSISNSGNDRTIDLAVTFNTAFGGDKTVYMFARDSGGLSSGWQTRGAWTVPTEVMPAAPVAVSVTPESGSGAEQTFGFTFSDPNGTSDIGATLMLISNEFSGVRACYILEKESELWLRDDANSIWMGPVSVGAVNSLTNSQCTLNAEDSSISNSGNSRTLSLALTFDPAFAGDKTVFMWVRDSGGLSSEWETRGTWNVPTN